MRGLAKFALLPAIAGVLAVTAVSFASLSTVGPVANAQSGPTLGIDAEPSDNTATSLGTRNVCIAVHEGDTFNVDITTENVTQLSAWEAYVALDTSVVSIVDRDVQHLLASTPGSNVFDISESVPEDAQDDGRYRVGGAIITDPPIGIDGSGVLARLTFEAVAKGVTTLSIQPIQTDAREPVGPVLTDTDANHLGDSNGDSFFDGPILDAKIAVDQDCPTDGGGPVAALTGGDSGGVSAWIILAAALGLVATAGFGGIALFRLRRASKSAT